MESKKSQLKALARNIKVIVSDVDGVLTDGYIFVTEQEQEPFGKFSIYDGMGVAIAHACGLKIIVLSGRKSLCTEARCKKLGIDEVYTGIDDKRAKLIEIAQRLNLDLTQMAYLGDDLIDLQAMAIVGFRVAPKNAIKLVQQRVNYITKAKGGEGALRELIELILKAQGKYQEYIKQYLE